MDIDEHVGNGVGKRLARTRSTYTVLEGYKGYRVRVELVRENRGLYVPAHLKGAADVYEFCSALRSEAREIFLGLYLDQKNRVVDVSEISCGSIAASLVHPREVFKAAILANSAALLVVHNHPSGDPTPSREDREITARLKNVGEVMGIPLMDHVIIGADSYRSFAENGLL